MSDPYVAMASLEWRLGCCLSEWQAARKLAERLSKDPAEVDQPHCAGVIRLLRDTLQQIEDV